VIRFLVRTAVMLVANALGLIVAALILGDVKINVTGFIEALVIFTVALALLTPVLETRFDGAGDRIRSAGAALVATLAALVITDLISNGFTVHGIGAWFAATFIVWVATVVAWFLAPFFGLRRYLQKRDERR
jgi:cytochrome c biogenesis factor